MDWSSVSIPRTTELHKGLGLMGKMKIRVHESNATLLDSFDKLALHLTVEDTNFNSPALRDEFRDIVDGATGTLDSPEELKAMLIRHKQGIVDAFEQVISKLDDYTRSI